MSDDHHVGDLQLSTRALRRLVGAGIRTIEALRQCSDDALLALPGFGVGCLKEVRQQLALWDSYQASRGHRPSFLPFSERLTADWRLSPTALSSPRTEARNQEQEASILALHQQGYTPRQMAQELGLSRQRVYLYLKRLDCTPILGRYPAIVQAHQQGLPPRQIAQELHIPLRSIYDCLKKRGYTPHRQGRPNATRQTIQALYEQGQTPRQIALVLGYSVQAVYWHLRRLEETLSSL